MGGLRIEAPSTSQPGVCEWGDRAGWRTVRKEENAIGGKVEGGGGYLGPLPRSQQSDQCPESPACPLPWPHV